MEETQSSPYFPINLEIVFVCLFFTQELINTLLCVDQSKRITATEALKHPWIVVCLCNNVSLVFRLFQRIRQSFCLCFEF